ncbi:anchored repeat ABC transporter, substrate-binding protein [Buchananella hordeovulneris]|uniref:anchored repeat ABC transporter, substrate-binding protein n=1 Tax=Buchananella hordeovulneris TaxID=52770 RepID=UPI0026DD1C90|nr:anchored repeat ABC transporter, substrate-binding protein [Buchananella hordeovulneris]MDO5079885.1 anchored repeat ABC transporter, substrate-binding protein [Buchananella hordeovulneris]
MNSRHTLAALLAATLSLGACAAKPALAADSPRLQVVATTGILRDLVQNVGGDRVDVVSLIPDSADPHSYEPTLRDARNVVYADVAFSNYAMLEEQAVIRTLDANLRPGVPNVSLAEESIKYAAELIPLVENINLDTVWLGLRATGTGSAFGATRTSQVRLYATGVEGPGEMFGYLTGSFGQTEVSLNSADGFDAAAGYKTDSLALPVGAHTHLSWAFTAPGTYELTMGAALQTTPTARPQSFETAAFTFAVGVNPAAAAPGRVVLDQGHADLAIDIDTGKWVVFYDPSGGGEATQQRYTPEEVVLSVPSKAIAEIPAGEQFSFIGKAGTDVYQLPQAVLGKHVHGEIDPHLWQRVGNAMAYVQLIRDTLSAADPAGAVEYRANAEAYLAELAAADDYVRTTIATIPPERRYLVTTHDAFGYLAHEYGLQVAGFVTPNPAVEESLAGRRKLGETIRNLHVPAVFLEPNLAARASTLTEVAAEHGIAVCPIYGDTFDARVTDYVSLVRFNADSLAKCLRPASNQAAGK